MRDFSQERGDRFPAPCVVPKNACFFRSLIQPKFTAKFPHRNPVFLKKKSEGKFLARRKADWENKKGKAKPASLCPFPGKALFLLDVNTNSVGYLAIDCDDHVHIATTN